MNAAERALEIDQRLDVCHPTMTINSVPMAEIRAILRHYAEIMQAEPVAEVCNPDAFVQVDWNVYPATVCSPFSGSSARVVRLSDSASVGSLLIIKPQEPTK